MLNVAEVMTINTDEIPDIRVRELSAATVKAATAFFELPGTAEKFEAWLKARDKSEKGEEP